MSIPEILSQALEQVRAQNPDITSLHVEATVYADGDSFLRFEAHVPGEQIYADTQDELMAAVIEEAA